MYYIGLMFSCCHLPLSAVKILSVLNSFYALYNLSRDSTIVIVFVLEKSFHQIV